MASSLPTHTIDIEKLRAALIDADTDSVLFPAIVNAPFALQKVETAMLFLGIIVLLQTDKKNGTINRVALSDTELAKNTTNVSYVPFHEIKIPLSHPVNIIARAVATGQPQDTDDWEFLFTPVLTAEQARINQASGGIAYSAVYPLKSRDGGALIFSYYQYSNEIGKPQHAFMQAYASLVDEHLA